MFLDALKYIVILNEGIEVPIIFPALIEHLHIANRLGLKVLSAGMLRIYPMKNKFDEDVLGCSCYDKSVSLNLQSRPEDTKLLTTELNRPLGN